MTEIWSHLAVLGVAFVTVVAVTPVVRWTVLRAEVVAEVGERHVHTRSTPTLGGLAIFAGLIAATAAGSLLPAFSDVFVKTNEPEAILLGSVVIVVVGWLDDVRGLSPPAKLAGQILAAGTVVLFGLGFTFVYIPGGLGVVYLSPDIAALITVIAIVAMMNAVNLVDGLDGLAAGIVAIAAGALLVYGQFAAPNTVTGTPSAASLVLAAVVGACLGFLVYNFHPALIFMGDTGALLLGLLLAAGGVSTIGSAVGPGAAGLAGFSVPVLIPALVFALPFADTAFAVARRLWHRRAISVADTRHLHHRLLARTGGAHRRAVLVMYCWSALLACATVGLALVPPRLLGAFILLDVALAMVALAVARPGRSAGNGGRQTSSECAIVAQHTLVHPFTKAVDGFWETGPGQQEHVETEV